MKNKIIMKTVSFEIKNWNWIIFVSEIVQLKENFSDTLFFKYTSTVKEKRGVLTLTLKMFWLL